MTFHPVLSLPETVFVLSEFIVSHHCFYHCCVVFILYWYCCPPTHVPLTPTHIHRSVELSQLANRHVAWPPLLKCQGSQVAFQQMDSGVCVLVCVCVCAWLSVCTHMVLTWQRTQSRGGGGSPGAGLACAGVTTAQRSTKLTKASGSSGVSSQGLLLTPRCLLLLRYHRPWHFIARSQVIWPKSCRKWARGTAN